MTTVDYKKNVPVLGSYEVVVAGAGPAGICAAVAAARSGARVALVERYGVLGGNLTAGYVGPILGMVGSGTMRDELMALLGVPENDMIGEVGVAHDMEQAKRVLAEFVSCENLDVFLQTPVVDALMAGASLEGLLVATKEGLRVMEGKFVIDATGDGVWRRGLVCGRSCGKGARRWTDAAGDAGIYTGWCGREPGCGMYWRRRRCGAER